MLAFRLSLDNAILFYEVCKKVQADTPEKREQVLTLLARTGYVENVTKTNMTRDQYIAHLAKNFKVMEVKQGE